MAYLDYGVSFRTNANRCARSPFHQVFSAPLRLCVELSGLRRGSTLVGPISSPAECALPRIGGFSPKALCIRTIPNREVVCWRYRSIARREWGWDDKRRASSHALVVYCRNRWPDVLCRAGAGSRFHPCYRSRRVYKYATALPPSPRRGRWHVAPGGAKRTPGIRTPPRSQTPNGVTELPTFPNRAREQPAGGTVLRSTTVRSRAVALPGGSRSGYASRYLTTALLCGEPRRRTVPPSLNTYKNSGTRSHENASFPHAGHIE